jgi:hypothetical protein
MVEPPVRDDSKQLVHVTRELAPVRVEELALPSSPRPGLMRVVAYETIRGLPWRLSLPENKHPNVISLESVPSTFDQARCFRLGLSVQLSDTAMINLSAVSVDHGLISRLLCSVFSVDRDAEGGAAPR